MTSRSMRPQCCPDLVGIHSISLAARCRVAACSTTLSQGLEKINTARGHNCTPILRLVDTGNCTPIFALSPIWEKEFLVPCSMMCRKTKNRKLPLGCFLTNSINKILLDLFPVAPRESWDRSVVIVLLTSCTT